MLEITCMCADVPQGSRSLVSPAVHLCTCRFPPNICAVYSGSTEPLCLCACTFFFMIICTAKEHFCISCLGENDACVPRPLRVPSVPCGTSAHVQVSPNICACMGFPVNAQRQLILDIPKLCIFAHIWEISCTCADVP